MKRTRIIALALAAVMVMGSSLTAFAAPANESQTVKETELGAKEATVYYDEGASFTITIPKVINIDTRTKTATYEVSATGDIKSDMKIKVTPEESFAMKDDAGNKADVTATIEQAKTEWAFDDATEKVDATPGNGTITAADLTAGTWTGTFDFTIEYVSAQ